MNKLEEIFDNKLGKGSKVYGERCLPRHYVVEKSAEITTDISIKFLEWVGENDVIFEKWGTNKITVQELFKEFINNHYE